MSFLKEAPNFELKLDLMKENRGNQLSDDVSNENKELLEPATTKAKLNYCLWTATTSMKLSKVYKLKGKKYLTKWRLNLQGMYGRITELLLEN